MEFEKKMCFMVENQIVRRGIVDEGVIQAMLTVKRHLFVEEAMAESAYGDFPLPIGDGQTISQPYMVAVMTEKLKLGKESRVLEIGTGSGYQTAILAEICERVYSIERIAMLERKARKRLEEMGYTNIAFKIGDGTLGWSEAAPFDGILITAGSPKVPDLLFSQLKEEGRMIIPIGNSFSQTLTVVRKVKGKKVEESFFGCTFVPLIGREGWEED
ncbi:MAG: protein-L-isoaspartate(D-aspartate) O-methyltransferase [Candidatus Cloacimonadota bacterium]|nr:MAG: protein-L-isoaspartate(D-aspartate) O-methyltransferase [Candidatus Cloacimonadota bacterium]